MDQNRVDGHEANLRIVRSDSFHGKIELPAHDDQRGTRLSEMSEVRFGIDERFQSLDLDAQLALHGICTCDHQIVDTEVTGHPVHQDDPGRATTEHRDEDADNNCSEEGTASCQSPQSTPRLPIDLGLSGRALGLRLKLLLSPIDGRIEKMLFRRAEPQRALSRPLFVICQPFP